MIDSLSASLFSRLAPSEPLVLMYHSIVGESGVPDWPWAVSSSAFSRQLDFLAKQDYLTPTLGALLDAPGAFSGRRVAVITFDDGYQDNLATIDLLKQRGMQASYFVVSGSLGKKPGWQKDHPVRQRLLDAAELRALVAAGMEVGSHSVNHHRLPTLDEATLRAELRDSKATLEDALGIPVSSFAYPYGAWDARCAEAVKLAGYRGACTTRTGWALRDGDPFRVRRLTVSHVDTVSSFARKLSLADNDVSWSALARQGLRRLRGSST